MAEIKSKATSLTPRQWALIGLLATTLAGAIYWPENDAVSSDAGQAVAAAPGATFVARAAAARAKARPKPRTWPQINLDAVLHHDPFSSSAFVAAEETDADAEADAAINQQQQEAELLSLRQDGVSMVLQNESGGVAVIGERSLRIGDVVDGYRVVAIGMDGVVMERIEEE